MLKVVQSVIAISLYTAVFTLLLPIMILRLYWRARRTPAYRERISERFGFISSRPKQGGIWVHAVSVGEAIAAVPMIKQLQREYPDRQITVTTTTPTGAERVRHLLGDSVKHLYAPFDWPPFVWFFLRALKPKMAIIMETELWPVMIAACKWNKVPVILANARLSKNSYNGYAKVRWLSRFMMQRVIVATQNTEDAERFVALGLPRSKLLVTGSIKFDVRLSDAIQARVNKEREIINHAGKHFVWIAASTHEGEDEIVLEAHRLVLARYPDVLLILVPRHPERFDTVTRMTMQYGFSAVRRSDQQPIDASVNVLIGNTMGELLGLFGLADIAFVGGSLVSNGGHNMLEPAVWGVPVLSGPYIHNFAQIAAKLEEARALRIVDDVNTLADAVMYALESPVERQAAGAAAVQVIEENRGAQAKLGALLRDYLS